MNFLQIEFSAREFWQARFGFQSKPTCNTSIYVHGGRVFAASENNLPYEINVSDLSTVGVFDFKGAWSMDNFTAHPKVSSDLLPRLDF